MASGHSSDFAAIMLRKAGLGGCPMDGRPNSLTAATSATGVPSGYVAPARNPTLRDTSLPMFREYSSRARATRSPPLLTNLLINHPKENAPIHDGPGHDQQ